MRYVFLLFTASIPVAITHSDLRADKSDRPNILFAIADDWGWPHASAYGDPVVKTPTFDRVAREGVLFHNAYISSPSCTPSRAAILTGQYHWRLEESANLWSTLQKKFPVYPDLLEESGYFVGYTRKGWGPGRNGDRSRNPAGEKYKQFSDFLAKRPKDQPFCFWFGSSDPHRGYKPGSGKASGMKLENIKLPACFPDSEEVRSDVADYYWEVQRFDREVGGLMQQIEKIGELDNTLVVITGDHGMPFPRCKSNLYDSGARVPLAIRWPRKIKSDRTVTDFVSLTDLAPTFLDIAKLERSKTMTGRSLMGILGSPNSGRIEESRNRVFTGKERHVACMEAGNSGGYPCRAIRTDAFLYIRNFTPQRWPAGTPDFKNAFLPGAWYGDCDNGPTKTYIIDHRTDPKTARFFELAFAKRPAEELYDLSTDPNQLNNVATLEEYAKQKSQLSKQLMAELKRTADPRIAEGGEKFDRYPYYGGTPRKPGYRIPQN